MDFEFSTAQLLGMTLKETMKKNLLEAVKGYDNSTKLILLEANKEVTEECIKEIQEEM